ncbi:hypothetical protein HO173_012474 [Letharia columbiana]|uniref:Uncharacterized protein n=1 Tax=Letharia columbiana TaxID=112416 RepID=A0A8H6CNT0_9LECA|nr:uncharacterized protein HO173_012474 [Letharia columbiana]KAF6226644.1 hypothetical protein HO173_012474 [Letharia columbiana]
MPLFRHRLESILQNNLLAYSPTLPTHQVSLFPSDYPPFAASNPSDREPDGTAWTADDVLSHGGSRVIGPLGTFLAEPVGDKGEIVYAELRMGELMEAKMDFSFDPVGSHSRPGVL